MLVTYPRQKQKAKQINKLTNTALNNLRAT